MKKKRLISLLLVVAMVMTLFTGCGSLKEMIGQMGKDDKISISMYMWDRSMFKEFTPWLEQKFPDIEFTFIQSYNTIEYYKDLLARGEDMSDIITCRRFSLNDAAALSDHLMDLSQTEVAGTFYSSYLEVNREDSGVWLTKVKPKISRWVWTIRSGPRFLKSMSSF